MRRRRAVLTAFLALAVVTACGDAPDTTSTDEPPDDNPTTDESEPGAPTSEDTGTIAVHIEEVDGVFVEGFEVGLRFETPDGEVIASTLWSDFVESLGDESIDAYYDSVLEQEVPAGTVVVLASANVGMGPPPEVPDLDGELRCRLDVVVPTGDRSDVEVTFDDPDTCLRQP